MNGNGLSLLAEKLANLATEASFKFWQDEEFRKIVDFKNLSQTEQDRIFNELEVTALGLSALWAEHYPILIKFQQETADAFIKIMKDLGIEEEFLDTWKLLIKLRFKEYKKDYKILLKESHRWEEIKNEDEFRPIWGRVETLTLNCVQHIRRGKLEKEDLLIHYLKKWIMVLETAISPEVKKILATTPLGNC
ncbi:MAG: hypothetical protein V1808_00130 [Candidatus Daviesbacteria bacterium]